MTPCELISAFETLADAPDGVKRLRELVLRLAVQGNLVKQEAASRGDDPHKIPTNWTLRKLSELALDFQNGLATRGGDGPPVVVLRLADIKKGRITDGPFRNINIPTDAARKYKLLENDILVIRVNGSADLVGRFIRVDRAAEWTYCDHLIRLRLRTDIVLPEFLVLLGETRQAREHLSSVTITTAGQRTVNQKGLGSLVVPLPPLADQRRIVARVDELMGLLDRLEAARAVRDEVRRAARDAALSALRDAEDTEAVAIAWGRISGQMDALFNIPEDVVPLRQTIRQLAVRGRLVPQSPSDATTSTAIAEAKEQLASLPSVRGRIATNEQIRGDAVLSVGEWGARVIPDGWVEIALSSVTRLESGHTPDRAISQYWRGDFCWIGIQDARRHRGGTIFETETRITQDGIDNSAARLLPAGTVCLSRTASVGYTVIMGGPMCTSQDFVNFVCTPAIAPRYLQLILEAEYAALKRFAKGAVHLTIYFPEVKAFHILLPPVVEQHTIIAKVDALMALCDDLEAHLNTARTLQVQFSAAAVHHLDA